MKIRFIHTVLLFLLTGWITGCSTEKNTRVSRAYHNLTSHYNIYFNGKESMKAGLARVEEGVDDDYTRILPVYKESYPTSASAAKPDMENAILKGSKLIQDHSITNKPKRRRIRTRNYQEFARKEEFNNWIDDSYLLIGQAYFYQHNFMSAIENFSYVMRKFSEEESKFDAMVWLARSYAEMERFTEAFEMLQALQADPGFPKRLEKELAKVNADFYLKQNEYSDAIKLLEIALDKTSSRKEKARIHYILAQLYRETGNLTKASEAFLAVPKYNPPYKMAFNARINAAGLFTGETSAEELKKDLNKMLRDEKNLEFRDQIYFALANIYFREGNSTQAIENYKMSVATSVDNDFQRTSSSLTLAEIYFQDKRYREAQAYYDTAMMAMDKAYPGYQEINIRYNGLTRLVENLETVEIQDSLQNLARMPENERNAQIDKWIAIERQKERDAEMLANQQSMQSNYYRANEYRLGLGRADEGGGWYFYNPQTVSYGRTQFTQLWGRRKLEDDWRRQNKGTFSDDELGDFAELVDSSLLVPRETDPMKREYYTQDLPVTDSLMAISHDLIRDALYNAGKIFKSDFNDYPRSAETFEDLNRRYPNNVYLLSALFDLYDVNELMGNRERALYYRDMIVQRYPESNYAQYLLNPNFFTEMQEKQETLNRMYQDAFRDYKSGKYSELAGATASMKELEPDSLLLSKIDFIASVSRGVTTNMKTFENELNTYIDNYPDAETTPLANEILTLIQDSTLADYQKLVDLGYLHEEIQNTEVMGGNTPENDEFGGKFSYDEELVHYFVIAYPRNADLDLNRLKFDIANYNLDHYTRYDFDVEGENLDANTSLLVVRSLGNKEQALIYFRAIIRKAEVFRTLNGIEYYNFVISSTNHRQITADQSIAEYLRFYLKNYSRFIGPDFSEEEIQESPEELMARAQREDEILGEGGRFVSVDVPVVEAMFSPYIDTTQSFVIAVHDKNLSLRPVLTQFAEFNRREFRVWNLSSEIKQSNEYQFVVISGIPGYTEGMSYFRKAITERSLFTSLGTISYRNFMATEGNLLKLTENEQVDSYMDFFRTSYIQRAGQAPPAGAQTSPSGQVETQPQEQPEPEEGTDTAPESSIGYTGPYSTNTTGAHQFILVVPTEGFNKQQLMENLGSFNEGSYNSLDLQISESTLDDFRILIQISGLPDKTVAMEYLRTIVQNRLLFAPLENADYRNFIATPENLAIFVREKNIADYMDFYRLFYLNR